MIKPRVVTPLDGIEDSSMVISVGTDTAECMDALMGDPSKAMVRHLRCTSRYIGAQIHYSFW